MQFGTSLRNHLVDQFAAHVGASPKLRFLTGSMPASPATAQSGTLIAPLTLPSTWLNAASNGQATKAGTWSGTSVATGEIGYARLLNSAESVVHWQGTVSAAFALTTSASTAANGNVLTFTSTTGVAVGQGVYGSGIPSGTTVIATTSTTVTLSQVSTAGVSNATEILFGDVSGDMHLASLTVSTVGQTVTINSWTLVAPGA